MSRKLKRKPSVVSRHIAGEELLVPIRGRLADMQRLFTTNEVGAFVWEQLARAQTEEQLVEAVVARFVVGLAQAQADVREFIEHLLAADLIEAGHE